MQVAGSAVFYTTNIICDYSKQWLQGLIPQSRAKAFRINSCYHPLPGRTDYQQLFLPLPKSIVAQFFVKNKFAKNMRAVKIFTARYFFTFYSNSIVAGGLLVQSYITRLTPLTSLTIRLVTLCSTSHGRLALSAVMKSLVMTARSAMA